jgi:ATP-binding cassette subfamily B multidrug efflux pump
MFKFLENLVDPYASYEESDTPPTKLFPFMWEYSKPFKVVFAFTAVMSLVVASVEVGLIYYMGRVVDLLGGDPAQVWAEYGTELIVMAVLILTVRPLLQIMDVALLNNTILPDRKSVV